MCSQVLFQLAAACPAPQAGRPPAPAPARASGAGSAWRVAGQQRPRLLPAPSRAIFSPVGLGSRGQGLVRSCREAELRRVLPETCGGSRAPQASQGTAASVSFSSLRVMMETTLEVGIRVKCLAQCLAHSRCFISISSYCNFSAETPESYPAF